MRFFSTQSNIIYPSRVPPACFHANRTAILPAGELGGRVPLQLVASPTQLQPAFISFSAAKLAANDKFRTAARTEYPTCVCVWPKRHPLIHPLGVFMAVL